MDRLRAYVGGESQHTRQLKPTIGDYMNSYIDMHIHTTYSDGTLTPSEILERSLEIGLKAISITDHNTINGVTEAMKYANSAIEIIPGIEMTATYPKPLHILGYYIDIHSASFNDGIKTLRMQKYKWLLMLVRNLKKIGIDIDLDEIKHKYGRIKLEYIALELVNQGIAENIRDIYLLYFNNRNFIKETPSSPKEIISLIKQAGGISILAHPFVTENNYKKLGELVRELKEFGLNGLECFHSDFNADMQLQLVELANQYHLMITGGSDFHGTNKPDIELGFGKNNLKIDYEVLEKIKKIHFTK